MLQVCCVILFFIYIFSFVLLQRVEHLQRAIMLLGVPHNAFHFKLEFPIKSFLPEEEQVQFDSLICDGDEILVEPLKKKNEKLNQD